MVPMISVEGMRSVRLSAPFLGVRLSAEFPHPTSVVGEATGACLGYFTTNHKDRAHNLKINSVSRWNSSSPHSVGA